MNRNPKKLQGYKANLPNERSVGAYKVEEDGGALIAFEKPEGAMCIKTELRISKEAAQALVNLMAIIGFQVSDPVLVKMEIPSVEFKPDERGGVTAWRPESNQ